MPGTHVALCGGPPRTIDMARRLPPVRTSYGFDRDTPSDFPLNGLFDFPVDIFDFSSTRRDEFFKVFVSKLS